MGNIIMSRADLLSLIIVVGILIMMIAIFLFEIKKKYCKICGIKISSSEGKICGGCYVEEMLTGKLPDRRRKKRNK